MEAFLKRSIVPKLATLLEKEFQINPRNQIIGS
jgi:hypothetical protein